MRYSTRPINANAANVKDPFAAEVSGATWDFTCVHRLAASYQSVAVAEGPGAANIAEDRKMTKYSELEGNHLIQPVAIETTGALGSTTAIFLKNLGKRIARITDERRSGEFLRQRLGIAVQIGNCATLQETFPSNIEPLLDDLLFLTVSLKHPFYLCLHTPGAKSGYFFMFTIF